MCFIDVVVWARQAETCSQYLKKGSGVFVEGRLKLDTWETSEGQKRSKHRVVAERVQFLPRSSGAPEGREVEEFGGNYNEQPADGPAKGPAKAVASEGSEDGAPYDDEVPF